MVSKFVNPLTKPPLDDKLYSLSPLALDFFKSQTGIDNEDALREHILTVQRRAYEVGIQAFHQHQPLIFIKIDLRLSMHPQFSIHEVRQGILLYSHY